MKHHVLADIQHLKLMLIPLALSGFYQFLSFFFCNLNEQTEIMIEVNGFMTSMSKAEVVWLWWGEMKKTNQKNTNYGGNVPWSLLCPEGRKSRTQTNAGLHILTSKATGLVVILHFLSFPISILTNMNPNSRQVYTCISSADRLCISHTVSILFFFSFSFF